MKFIFLAPAHACSFRRVGRFVQVPHFKYFEVNIQKSKVSSYQSPETSRSVLPGSWLLFTVYCFLLPGCCLLNVISFAQVFEVRVSSSFGAALAPNANRKPYHHINRGLRSRRYMHSVWTRERDHIDCLLLSVYSSLITGH